MTDSNWHVDGKLWPTIQPPLVPTPADVELILAASRPALDRAEGPPRILVLGVTPALLDAPWPEGSEVHAVDYDRQMVELFWRSRPGQHCHCDRWQDMPLPDDHFDLVVGDCSFNALPGLADYGAVLREIARVSRPGATLACRFFLQPEPHLTFERAIDEMAGPLAGCGASVSRLLLALASADDDASLRFGDMPVRVAERWGDFGAYLERIGQQPEDIERTLKIVESDQRLNYPSRAQILHEFAQFFGGSAFAVPDYPVGPYCPSVSFS